jgi:hypothetical protein
MPLPIVYIDHSDIHEGKLEVVKRLAHELVEFVDTHEPQLISYGFFFSEDGTRMSVVAMHPDSASLELHLDIGGPAFSGFKKFIRLRSIEVYGTPSDDALKRLRQKARMLGADADVVVHELQSGFARSRTRVT